MNAVTSNDPHYFLSSDYVNATDHICWNVGTKAWRAFADGMSISDPYVRGAIL